MELAAPLRAGFCPTPMLNLSPFLVRLFLGLLVLANLFWACQEPSAAPSHTPLEVSERISPEELFSLASHTQPIERIDAAYQKVIKFCGEHDQMERMAEHLKFYEQLRSNAPATVQVFLLNAHALQMQFAGKLDSSDVCYRRAIALAEQSDLPQSGKTDALRGLGTNAFYRGEYGKSTETLLQAMHEYQRTGDSANLNRVKLEQCGNLFRTFDCEEMRQMAASALPWFAAQRDTFFQASIYNIFGLYYECSTKFDSAIVWHQKTLDLRRAIGDKRGEGETLNNMAVLFVKQKRFAEALEHYRAAIQLMQNAGDLRNVTILQSNLGRCFQNMGNYPEAIRQYEEAQNTIIKNGQLDAAVINLERLAGTYRRSGDYQKAVDTYLKSRFYRDSLFDDQKRKDIREINTKFETALKEQQIARLEAQRRSNQLWLSLLALGSLLLLTAASFYIFRLRQKQKLLAREKQLAEMREQAQLKDLEIAQLEIDFNHRQLAEATSNLSEKSRLVEELREGLDALRQSLGENHLGDEVQRSLSVLYSMKILTDDDWNDFRVQFEQVHPGLIKQFRARFPDIADAELRLILLLKMGVRSREIATMLGISPESVKKTRYRLRKRLNLGEYESLEEFVGQFE